jgi:hypothetical protein
MTPEARSKITAEIIAWQRRTNSGTGNRRKSSRTAQRDAQFIVNECASGKTYAVDFVAFMVNAAGYEVTHEDVAQVADEMLHPEQALQAEYRDAADKERSLREWLHW